MNKTRYLEYQIIDDLAKKMVFLGGPRQVGKTTLAKSVIKNPNSYLNWDILEDKNQILNSTLPNTDEYIFDELHKYSQWRGFIKGLYDKHLKDKKILVTGSARLDFYRYGGDSLQGRYHYLRLHPFSVKELKLKTQNEIEELFQLGLFPDQILPGKLVDSKRWSLEYRKRLINEDIVSLESIHDLSLLELLIIRLSDLVGSPLSVNSLREDLSLAFKTVNRWLEILERMYAIFRLKPFSDSLVKSVKKEQKHYHYDFTQVKKEGPRFENFMALHLLKWCHYQYDCFGNEYELKYYRDSQAREVDFVITLENKPYMFIETKLQSTDIDKNLVYLKNKFPEVPSYQIIFKTDKEFVNKDGIILQSAIKFLQEFV